jgi:signal transduction histidine kinase
MPETRSRRWRLPVSPAWWAILLSGLLLGLPILHFRDRVRELEFESRRKQQLRCEELARRLDSSLLASRQLTLSLAEFGPGAVGDRAGAERLLRRFMNSVSDDLIYGIGLWYGRGVFAGDGTGLHGPYLHRSKPGETAAVLTYEWATEAYDYPNRPWYRQALASREAQSFTEPYADLDDVYMSSVAAMRAEDGRLVGVVTVDVTLSSMRAFFAAAEREFGGSAYVTTRDGRLLFHSEEKRLLGTLRERGIDVACLLAVEPAALGDLMRTMSEERAGGGVARCTTEAGWTVHFAEAGSGSLSELRRQARVLFGVLIAIILLMCGALALVYLRVRAQRHRQDMLEADLLRRVRDERRMERRRRLLEEVVRRRTAELARINLNKDRLMSMLAHDTRGYFMVIRSYAGMLGELIDARDEVGLREASADLLLSANRACTSFEEILAWVAAQAQGVESRCEALCLRDVVADACALAETQAKLKGVSLSLEIGLVPDVCADRGIVATVIRNLLANAVKFTAEGGRVAVRAYTAVDDVGFVTVEVADSGVGMRQEEADALFMRAGLRSRPGTAGEHGLGLGLSICREMCRKLGGRIWMKSAPNVGSTVSFTLPVAGRGSVASGPA